jgi:competence protein ComEC
VLNKEIPFIRIGFPICLGIISGLYFKPGITFLAISAIIIITGFLISLLYNKGLVNQIFGIPLIYSFFICGLMLYTNEKKQISDLEPVTGEYLCSLSEYPEEKENSYGVIVRIYARLAGNGPVPVNGSMMIYFRKDSLITSLLPGDFLKIICNPKLIESRGNPYEFDYRFYMENHGIKYYTMSGADDIIFHAPPSHRKLKHKALMIREKIIDMYKRRGITGDRLALVAAITLGQKSMLEPEQKLVFIKAGVMHIMAVSGLHAVILSLFIFNLLFFMKGRFNFLRIIIIVLMLWAFAFVTGLTPSVLRATIMFSFLQAGTLMKRNVNSINSVLASAVILLIIHPSVLFDAGFLLSYSAVIFIICFYRNFYLKLTFRNWAFDKIWQSAAVTIIAQAGTLPLTISLFNRFPTWFILTNIIIVPLSSFLIIIGCLVLLTFPFIFISQPLASLLNYLTGLTESLTEKAASLPLSTIENIGLGNIESALLFSFIFLFMMFILNRKTFPVRYPLCALLLFVLAGSVSTISDRTSGELIVYNGTGLSPIGIRTGRNLNLFTDNDTILPEVARHCFTRGLKLNMIKTDSEAHLIKVDNKSILICNDLSTSVVQKIKPDIIILKGKYPKVDREVAFPEAVEGLILTSEVATGYRLKPDFNGIYPDTIHYVRISGAFRARL